MRHYYFLYISNFFVVHPKFFCIVSIKFRLFTTNVEQFCEPHILEEHLEKSLKTRILLVQYQ